MSLNERVANLFLAAVGRIVCAIKGRHAWRYSRGGSSVETCRRCFAIGHVNKRGLKNGTDTDAGRS
jgi:hypothetical protein